ncbi:MAG: nucleotidyltransferase domain-containing protein [Nitrospirae bacterium]|nr:nucleotidyltransferase domain-containing protein [Nitrospirota bacterium]
MSREQLFKRELRRAVDKIKAWYKPEKIFVFGSFASGKITADSDLDFFIIKKTDKPRRERQREVSRLLIDREVPVDILVYTPAETERRKRLGDPFILDILNSGKLLYAKK